jgi:hypothetical protein
VAITLPYGDRRRQLTHTSNNTDEERENLPRNKVCHPKENKVFHKGKCHTMMLSTEHPIHLLQTNRQNGCCTASSSPIVSTTLSGNIRAGVSIDVASYLKRKQISATPLRKSTTLQISGQSTTLAQAVKSVTFIRELLAPKVDLLTAHKNHTF